MVVGKYIAETVHLAVQLSKTLLVLLLQECSVLLKKSIPFIIVRILQNKDDHSDSPGQRQSQKQRQALGNDKYTTH